MWVFRLVLLLALTGCLDGWEKNPSTEKGIPLAEKVQEKDYPAPSPAAFNLTLMQVSDNGDQSELLGVVQAQEGERLQISAKAEIYDSKVSVEEIVLLNPEAIPGAQMSFNQATKELLLDWQIPERFVQSEEQNFQVSSPIIIRMQAYYTSVTPEGDKHTEARQIEKSFQYIVYRNLFGLEPTILSVDPPKLEMVENEVLRFDLIIEDPGSSQILQAYDPEVRIVPIVPTTNSALSDGSHFVRRDKTKPVTLEDPNQPTVWRVPMLMDLRGKEVTPNTNLLRYGVQAVSKYGPNNNISCSSSGECEFKAISSRVVEVQTRVYTELQSVRTSMTFSPVVRAGVWNFVQWQLFDPEDNAEINVDTLECPQGASCSCSRVGRDKHAQCMLEWKPKCGQKDDDVNVSLYAQSSSRVGPPRVSPRRKFVKQVRVSQELCPQQEGAQP